MKKTTKIFLLKTTLFITQFLTITLQLFSPPIINNEIYNHGRPTRSDQRIT